MRKPTVYTTVYAHKGCNDGHLAAALCVEGLIKNGLPRSVIALQFVSASLREMKIPIRDDVVQFASGDIQNSYHAIFVDLSPTQDHVPALEAFYDKITVFDHHASSQSFLESKVLERKWVVHHDMKNCGSHLVFHYFFGDIENSIEFTGGDFAAERVRHVVEMTDKYDTWKSPTPDVFKFSIASSLLWTQCTQLRTKTTVDQLLNYLARLCLPETAEIDALTGPVWNALDFELRTTFKFEVQLPTANGDKINALCWFGDSISNPSILCHLMLEQRPEYEVCVCLFRRIEAGKVVYSASLRSRTLDIPLHLSWARGHANACGGILPDSILPQVGGALPQLPATSS